MLAKAFDYYCKPIGYKNSLTDIERWLSNNNPNVKRAVVEGLRIWITKPYFNENPTIAIQLITQPKHDESKYLRKSIGNAMRDIRKGHKNLIDTEILNWDLTTKNLLFIQQLVTK